MMHERDMKQTENCRESKTYRDRLIANCDFRLYPFIFA